MQAHPALFLSYGKEKLLWGPSFLASPSNVLFPDTEDGAGQLSSILEWRLSDRVQLFNVNAVNIGGPADSEFAALLDRSFMIGLEVFLF